MLIIISHSKYNAIFIHVNKIIIPNKIWTTNSVYWPQITTRVNNSVHAIVPCRMCTKPCSIIQNNYKQNSFFPCSNKKTPLKLYQSFLKYLCSDCPGTTCRLPKTFRTISPIYTWGNLVSPWQPWSGSMKSMHK